MQLHMGKNVEKIDNFFLSVMMNHRISFGKDILMNMWQQLTVLHKISQFFSALKVDVFEELLQW